MIKLRGNHDWLNFARLPVKFGGETVHTNEHFFQHLKTLDPFEQEAILAAPSPRSAKYIGRKMIKLRDDWEEVKFAIMVAGLLIKFSQYGDLRRDLLSTKSEQIAEVRDDPEWGTGPDGTGRNMMGKALMVTRSILLESRSYGR